jgi:poly-gamma-glutamate synthesis protein (capsule biosynthesis protein)
MSRPDPNLFRLLLLFALILFKPVVLTSADVRHPDELQCRDETPPRGWYMNTALDFSGEDGPLAYVYFAYKYFVSPRMEADCHVEEFFRGQDHVEEFFRGQDLRFGPERNQSAEITAEVSLAAVGDLMVRDHLDTANSAHLYDDVRKKLFSADIVFGNLESPANPALPTRPFPGFNLSAEAVRRYLNIDEERGFDIVSTANNHALDQGEEGLLATLDHLEELGVRHVGTSRSPEERDDGFPILEKGGVKTAFLAYTFSTNWKDVPVTREYVVNLVRLNTMKGEPDLSLIESHIAAARKRGADVVVVSLHWGHDYEFYPERRFIERAHRIADSGADIILGHHPHVLGPLESYAPPDRDQGTPEVLIAYSLGNFIPDSDSKKLVYETGMILEVTLAKGVMDGEERVWIKKAEITPTWWYSRMYGPEKDYRLINVNRATSRKGDESLYPFLSVRDWRKLGEARQYIQEKYGHPGRR